MNCNTRASALLSGPYLRPIRMSALGQKLTYRRDRVMSALPPKADIRQGFEHVCFVPKADIV
jgi:hypothetical protein